MVGGRNEVVIKVPVADRGRHVAKRRREAAGDCLSQRRSGAGRQTKDCSRRFRSDGRKTQRQLSRFSGTIGIGGRGRAEQDAVVRRLQEKFGAEIRTVIDSRKR